jgi:hypothetical protein
LIPYGAGSTLSRIIRWRGGADGLRRTRTKITGSSLVPRRPSSWGLKAAGSVGIRPSGATGGAIGGGVPAFRIGALARRLLAFPVAWTIQAHSDLSFRFGLRRGRLGRRIRGGIQKRREGRHYQRHSRARSWLQWRVGRPARIATAHLQGIGSERTATYPSPSGSLQHCNIGNRGA